MSADNVGLLMIMKAIGSLLKTQDNRITNIPLFVVQQKIRDYGYDPDYCDETVWINSEGDEADETKTKELENDVYRKFTTQATAGNLGGWKRIGYRDRWEFVTACFTEKAVRITSHVMDTILMNPEFMRKRVIGIKNSNLSGTS